MPTSKTPEPVEEPAEEPVIGFEPIEDPHVDVEVSLDGDGKGSATIGYFPEDVLSAATFDGTDAKVEAILGSPGISRVSIEEPDARSATVIVRALTRF